LAAPAALAHDFWIEPSTFRPMAGQMVTASLRVGKDFAGDPVPRSGELIESFTIDGKPVGGFEGRDPAGIMRIEKPGLAVIAYRSKGSPLELDATKFAQFLADEGITNVRANGKPDRERFFRFAKALLGSGETRPLGWRFELVPERDPSRLQLLFDGKPLAGVLVTALFRDDPHVRLSARTDARGRVAFALPRSGVWLVKSVHMIPALPNSGYDWESLWASLTFER
jgi:hypothetical protein